MMNKEEGVRNNAITNQQDINACVISKRVLIEKSIPAMMESTTWNG